MNKKACDTARDHNMVNKYINDVMSLLLKHIIFHYILGEF
jgi:hypothetical protein